MDLTEEPRMVNWSQTHYVFVEKIGPFQDTAPAAWQELKALVPKISKNNQITAYLSLYKTGPKMIYRAGVGLSMPPKALPAGLRYESFKGGNYACFILTGSWSNLPEACGRVFQIVGEQDIMTREDFCIEHYMNDPKDTPEDQLITEILIPVS